MDIVGMIQSFIEKKALALWCGAGISIPSGVPLVGSYDSKSDKITYGIIPKILYLIGNDEEDVKSFFKAKIPFEAFVEILVQNGLKLPDLKEVFKGEPSLYHYGIAKLLDDEKLLKICSTNFDQCIEKAFPIDKSNDLTVIHRADQFSSALLDVPSKALFKIHGCISDIQNIAITIKQIAKKENRSRDEVTKHFFSKTSTHSVLLIIGYSCSDYFDIKPQVEGLIHASPEKLCKVIYWEFEFLTIPKVVESHEVTVNAQTMLQHHPDTIFIKGDLSHLFQKINDNQIIETVKNHPWENIFENVYGSMTKDKKKLLNARIMYQINQRATAYNLFEEIINGGHLEEAELAIAYSNQGLILKHWGKMDEALDMHIKEQAIYEDLKDSKGLILSFGNQALLLRRLGKYDDSLNLHKREEELCRSMEDWGGVARSLGNQALVLKYQDKLDDALALHQHEVKIFIDIGDKAGEARSYGNQSLILRRKGLKLQSEMWDLIKKEEKIYLDLGNRSLIGHNYETQALLLGDSGDFQKCMELHKKAEESYRFSNDQWGLITTFANQGEILARKLERKEEGIELLEKAVEMAHLSKDGRIQQFISILEDVRKI